MAIDFLIFGLLLVSFVTNLLALGAFWVTPGLRTTANRFTINLLIINLIGCLILAPTLFLSSPDTLINSKTASALDTFGVTTNDDRIDFYSKPGNHQMTFRHNGQLIEKEGIIVERNVSAHSSTDARTIETIFKCNATFCQELTIDEGSDSIVITEIEEQQEQPSLLAADYEPMSTTPSMRCWSIDLAAALGSLAVLLVVGDTWCAITDPLRYHSRISGIKAWVLIAMTWVLGIVFGILSAFRELDFESTSLQSQKVAFAETDSISTVYNSWSSSGGIFSMVFASIYFIVIIMLPFGFVCGMYWRIFSEARENGLRMRQNGSSPLLQSALNLNGNQQHLPSHAAIQYAHSLCVHRNSLTSMSSHGGGGGLQFTIDQHHRSSPVACQRRDSTAKVLLPTISDDCGSDGADSPHAQLTPVAELSVNHMLHERRHNVVLLTLQSASGEIKRNYSSRKLPLLGTSSQDFEETQQQQGMRKVHSSPNLHKANSLPDSGATQLLPTVQRPYSQPPLRSAQHVQHQHVLQIPAIHASPKALSYMSSLRHRLSNASSLFKYREESRAARISILVVIMFLVSYLPYGFLVLLQSRISAANFAHSSQLAIFMLLLANLSSPFIFAYRNKRVRRGVKRLFGMDASTRERQLQRQSSSSGRGSSFLHMHAGNKFDGIRRTGSRVSTYSSNSCRYLTPQSSLVGASGSALPPVHSSGSNALRSNNSCSTVINLNCNPTAAHCSSNSNTDDQLSSSSKHNTTHDEDTTRVRPVLQRGITIVEQLQLPQDEIADSRNIIKMLCQHSKNLSCATQSCAIGVADNEPAAV